MAEVARLPTYRTAAAVLEREKGSGMRLVGWTLARTLLIGPPMMVFGIPAKQAFGGALLSSGIISLLTLLRVFDARSTGMQGLKYGKRQLRLAGARHR